MSCISKVERKLWYSHCPSLQLKCWAVSCRMGMRKWEQTLLPDLCNGCAYINVTCTMQCLMGTCICPFAGKSAPMLALLGEGKDQEAWSLNFPQVLQNSQHEQWPCVFGTLPVPVSDKMKLDFLTYFDHHGCSKTTTITLMHQQSLTHTQSSFVK